MDKTIAESTWPTYVEEKTIDNTIKYYELLMK